jgi:hypothetical protein
LAVFDRFFERALALDVEREEVGAVPQQHRHAGRVVAAHRLVQRRHAVLQQHRKCTQTGR